jgi:hypothetical protein
VPSSHHTRPRALHSQVGDNWLTIKSKTNTELDISLTRRRRITADFLSKLNPEGTANAETKDPIHIDRLVLANNILRETEETLAKTLEEVYTPVSLSLSLLL